jgi:hypothetical protein
VASAAKDATKDTTMPYFLIALLLMYLGVAALAVA